jgi:UDP-glucose 4-epimerase
MEKYDCKNMIFSSTATVYGFGDKLSEESPINPMHTYSRSKVAVELLMQSLTTKHPDWSLMILRYFNPVGAHSSSLIGDSPTVYPNNLFPFLE